MLNCTTGRIAHLAPAKGPDSYSPSIVPLLATISADRVDVPQMMSLRNSQAPTSKIADEGLEIHWPGFDPRREERAWLQLH